MLHLRPVKKQIELGRVAVTSSSKGLAKLGNIVAETLLLRQQATSPHALARTATHNWSARAKCKLLLWSDVE